MLRFASKVRSKNGYTTFELIPTEDVGLEITVTELLALLKAMGLNFDTTTVSTTWYPDAAFITLRYKNDYS